MWTRCPNLLILYETLETWTLMWNVPIFKKLTLKVIFKMLCRPTKHLSGLPVCYFCLKARSLFSQWSAFPLQKSSQHCHGELYLHWIYHLCDLQHATYLWGSPMPSTQYWTGLSLPSWDSCISVCPLSLVGPTSMWPEAIQWVLPPVLCDVTPFTSVRVAWPVQVQPRLGKGSSPFSWCP